MQAGETFTFLVDAGNVTGSGLTGVELRASLPAGLTVGTISDGGSTNSAGEVVWPIGSLGAGSTVHREVDVTVAAGASAGDIFRAVAELRHAGGLEVDLRAEKAVTVVGAAFPLDVDYGATPNPVVAGQRVLYDITVSNVSGAAINGVRVIYRTPKGITFDGILDADPDGAAGSTCRACVEGDEVRWNRSTLDAGESWTIQINALVVAGTADGTVIRAPVQVIAVGAPDTISVEKTVVVENTQSAQLALSASQEPVQAGETFTFLVDAGNVTGSGLTGVELRASLPAGLTVGTISDGGSTNSAGEVVWPIGSLGAGSTVHREVDVTVAAGASAGDIFRAVAELRHAGGLEVDLRAEKAVTVVGAAFPLDVDYGATPNPVVAGQRVLYDITVSNVSGAAINGVRVIYRTPKGITFDGILDADPDGAAGSTCRACVEGDEVRWNRSTLDAGESWTIQINALVVAGTADGTVIRAPVQVIAVGAPDTISVEKTVVVENTQSAQLALSASQEPVQAGETFTFLVDAGNVTGSGLTGVELRASLPAGLTVGTISDGGSTNSAGEVVWPIGSLGAGSTVHREVDVTVAAGASAGDIFRAVAELRHAGGLEVDLRAEKAVTVVGAAFPLDVDYGATPNPVVAGQRVLYDITVSNVSGAAINGVRVIYRTPKGITFDGILDADPDGAAGSTCRACVGRG